MKKLSAQLLPQLHGKPSNLIVPDAHLLALPEKVLQFGTGVLLRGLPDFFIDKANRQGVFNGRVVVVKSTNTGSADTFTEQDGLYTHGIRGIEHGKQVESFIINAAISRTLSANGQWKEILACAHNPALQLILSNTTEVGIQLTDDDLLQSPPLSYPGKLTAFLYERFKAFNGNAASGLVVIPCELIVDNGKKLKDIVYTLARRQQLDAAFMEWLEKHIIFCNSLVDRIVPGKPDEATVKQMADRLGYADDLLTISEVYRLWAVEGGPEVKKILSFAAADQGVIIEADITPFRERKLRLLNGTHTLSVGLGFLYGLETVGECMSDPIMSQFISNLLYREIVPAVPVDKQSARDFAAEVLDRFRNPFIVHPLISITLQYTSKMKMRNVQTLFNHYKKSETVPSYFALGFAAYLLFMKVVKEEKGKYYGEINGKVYPVNDDFAAYFYKNWQNVQVNDPENVRQFVTETLSDTEIWGTNLQTLAGFAERVSVCLFQLLHNGVQPTLQQFIADDTSGLQADS